MYRAAIENLKKWKNKKSRKPLVIEGARQVGKTWLMKEFGRQEYEKTVYINFDADKRAGDLFSENLNPDRIIDELSESEGVTVDKEQLHKEANAWQIRHGDVSGRCARQFVDYIKGKV